MPEKLKRKISEINNLISEFSCRVLFTDKIRCNGMTSKLLDGYVILINESLCYRKTIETIEHELWHIILGHLDDRSELSNRDKEIEVYNHMKKEVDTKK